MPKRKIVIFANGKIKNKSKAHTIATEATYIICADGGAIHCDQLGIVPDLVIGDLDSIPEKLHKKLQKKQVEIEQHPVHKNNTDLELALQRATASGSNEENTTIHILGGLGGRWDMSLATIFLPLANENTLLEIVIHGDKEVLRVLTPGCHCFRSTPGKQVSFLPLLGKVEKLTLIGFRYSVTDISLEPGSSRGVSNFIEEKNCRVQFLLGRLLMITNDA